MYENDIRVMGKVVASALGRASTGTEQVAVQFEYKDAQGQAHTITWYGYFSSEKSQEIADDALKALGWEPSKNGWNYYVLNDDSSENPILGKTASLVLGPDTDLDGNERMKVKFVNAGGGAMVKERMDPDAARAFSAKMRARVSGATVATPRPQPAKAPAPAAKPASPMGPPIPGVDDCPF